MCPRRARGRRTAGPGRDCRPSPRGPPRCAFRFPVRAAPCAGPSRARRRARPGITRHGEADEKAVHRRSSDPDGPESWGHVREGVGQALTGVRAARYRAAKSAVRSADGVVGPEGNTEGAHSRAPPRLRAVPDPVHARKSPCARTGRSLVRPVGDGARGRIGKANVVADDERTREVGRPIVPAKFPSKIVLVGSEGMEGRGRAKGSRPGTPHAGRRAGIQCDPWARPCASSSKEGQEGEVHSAPSSRDSGAPRKSYLALRRRASPGIDGRTWERYRQNLGASLNELHSKLHRGVVPTEAD